MGILDYDIELAKQAIKRTPGLLNEYIGRLNSTLQDKFAINEMDQKRSMRGLDAMAGGDLKVSKQKLDNAIAQKMVNVGLDMNPAAVGQIVWHGSPHKFNKFDMSKIGTGEGAQAYGHGLYMAEAPQVAKDYQKTLANDGFLVGDKVFDPSSLQHMNIKHIARSGDVDAAIAKAQSIAASDSPVANLAAQDLARLQEIKAAGGMKPNEGALYKVDIPDEAVARFLDWDKPLSQQAPEVSAGVRSALVDRGIAGSVADYIVANRTGRDAISTVARGQYDARLLPPEGEQSALASKLFSDQGIPGIRYLDGGSRGAGQGSSNFVLFDDQMPRILEINGQATGLQPWAKGEWRGLLGE